jgi:hypothetical protein
MTSKNQQHKELKKRESAQENQARISTRKQASISTRIIIKH